MPFASSAANTKRSISLSLHMLGGICGTAGWLSSRNAHQLRSASVMVPVASRMVAFSGQMAPEAIQYLNFAMSRVDSFPDGGISNSS